MNLKLRINTQDYSNESLNLIIAMFSKYFDNVEILDIAEQQKIIDRLCDDNIVVSMDKFIKTKHSIDCSRVHDINGNYLHHRILYNGFTVQNSNVILYDHDIINGIGFKTCKAILETHGNTVEKFCFEQGFDGELLDFDDFISSGLVIKINDETTKRIRYQDMDWILAKKASIPETKISEFKQDLNDLFWAIFDEVN